MHLSYNGIDLQVVREDLVDRTVLYDPSGVDYLGTRWQITVVATYSPDRYTVGNGTPMRYVTAGSDSTVRKGTDVPNTVPDPLAPKQGDTSSYINSPVWTDAALRHKLTQPRRKLRVTFNSGLGPPYSTIHNQAVEQLWLESPPVLPDGTAPPCDAQNGPLPQVHSVQDVFGDGRLFLVVFSISTVVNDCQRGLADNDAADDVPLLSNRWTASLAYDEQFLATRTVQGLAVFRSDSLQKFLRSPDKYRLNLLPPVPPNCKRFIDELTQHPDGFSYSYTIRDVEQAGTYQDRPTFPSGGIDGSRRPRNVAYFDIEIERGYEQQGTKTLIPKAIELSQQALWAAAALQQLEGGESKGSGSGGELGKQALIAAFGPEGALIGLALDRLQGQMDKWKQFGKAAVGLGAAAIGIANEFLPVFTEVISVTVAGNRAARMQDLQYLAFSAAFGQVTRSLGIRGGPLGQLAGLTNNVIGTVAGGALATVTDTIAPVVDAALAFVPTANVYNVRYNPVKKQLQFTLTSSYGGLVDWISGGTAGGWRAITSPIPDNVVGGDWPQSAKNNFLISGNQDNAYSKAKLPDLPDNGNEIVTVNNAPGIGPPVFNDGRGHVVMGTQVLDLFAQELMLECELPKPLPTATDLVGDPSIFGKGILRGGGSQLLP